jgi:curved DNA-binding protein CbpA
VKEHTPPITALGAKRRSTRVVQAIPLVITWTGTQSKTLLEETAALSINCHGCQYFSRFHVRKNTTIDVQVGPAKNLDSPSLHFPARVAWIRKSRRLGGMYQVGVEFDTPQNIWHIGEAPEDWNSFTSSAPKEDSISLLTEVERLLQFAHGGTFYELLGVESDAPRSEVKRQFYRLASRFHPDHQMDRPEWTPRLLVLMDSLTMAYRTLSDDDSKKQYDSRLIRKPQQKSSENQQSAQECLERSRECLAVKNYIGSILWLRRAIEVEPDSSSYRAMLGHSLAAVPEYRHEAVEQFQMAIKLDPSHIAAHFQYAQVLEQMKLPSRARPHYVRVLELDANHREARERLNRIDSAAPRPISRPSLLGRLAGRR